MIRTPVCDLLQIEHPIALGGMGSVYGPALTAAVSNAGGLGAMGCHYMSAEQIRTGTGLIREQTNKGFGLNFLLFDIKEEGFAAALALRPAVMAFAWPRAEQDLEPYIARAHDAGCKITLMTPNVPDAVRAAEAGADVIVAQGTEGGGHVGWQTTLTLVPMVVDAVAPVPVLAAGGICRRSWPCGSAGTRRQRRAARHPVPRQQGIAAACQFQAGDPGQRRPRHAAIGNSRPCRRHRLAGRDVALTAQWLYRALGRA